jgi:hypothetical protein
MKRKLIFALLLMLTIGVMRAPSGDAPVAFAAGEAISKWVIANGGGSSSGGNITIKDTLGQPIIGPSTGNSTGLYAGFWYAVYHPTAVTVASFTVTPQGNARILHWTTITEINLLGFNIYRATSLAGTQTKLNSSLIPSQALGGIIGATYAYSDANKVAGAMYYYWLEEVPATGESRRYGPITAGGIYLPFVTK